MEAPVAAALGKLDAFNLFDPTWTDPEYDIYYKMLDAGIKLPASTGSDWFVSNPNRVYAYTGGEFSYDDWLDALRQGRTFITNGPALSLTVADRMPGDEIETSPGVALPVTATWQSHYPIHRVEVLYNGKVVAVESHPHGSKRGGITTDISVVADGWVAARLWSDARDSFAQPVFAHTSPVYLAAGKASREKQDAGAWFDNRIETSMEWVRKKGKFYTDQQRREVLDLFRQGQEVYRSMR